MYFGAFDGASFAQYSKFRLYGIRIDKNEQYHAQTDFELHVCPYELRFETKSSGGWLSHFLVAPRLSGSCRTRSSNPYIKHIVNACLL